MKNTFYYIAIFLGLALTSCEPMEDIHDEINSRLENERAVGDIIYTLTEDDYLEELELSHTNFDSSDDAKSLLPGFLAAKYPNYGAKSSAIISFDIYTPVSTEKFLEVYTVSTEDYDSYPDTEKYDNFDDEDQIYTFLNDKYTDLENRTLVSLTYKFYDGSLKTLNNGFLYVNGEFTMIEGLTDAEYNMAGESYDNFSSEDEALAKLPIFLKEKYKYELLQAGDVKSIMYKLYTKDVQDIDGDGSTSDNAVYSYIEYFVFDGTNFSPYNNTVTESVKFGNIDGVWVPDNTIRFSLAGSDYSIISNGLTDVYPNPASSVGNYGNFDRRVGEDAYWNDDMILEAMNILLDNIDPSAEEGQKYVLTYDVYNGSNITEDISLIKEDGEWVLNQ